MPLAQSWLPQAAAMWRAEQLEVYRDPGCLPKSADSFDFFRDVVYPACESWWGFEERQSLAAILGLKHEHIAHLYVLPEWRGRGLGGALVAHARTIYRNGLTVTTSPHVSAFYRKLGFSLVEDTPDEFRLTWSPPHSR